MFSKKIKCVIFDFDNTIAGTEKYSWQAHNKALEKYGICLDSEHINKYLGHPDNEIFSMIEQDYNIKIDYNSHYKERINYAEAAIRKILRHWGIEDKFEKIYSILDMKSKKSLLIKNSSQYFGVEPQEIVLFEDSPNTINLAKSLGCETVYVYNGENLPECYLY